MKDPTTMRMTNILTKWLEHQGWDERPKINEQDQTSSTMFKFVVTDCFQLTCYFDIDEGAGYFKLFSYLFGTRIPEQKADEIIKWANLANIITPTGFVSLIPDKRVLRFYVSGDFQDAAFEPLHITHMLAATDNIMSLRIPQALAICFGDRSAERDEESAPNVTQKEQD